MLRKERTLGVKCAEQLSALAINFAFRGPMPTTPKHPNGYLDVSGVLVFWALWVFGRFIIPPQGATATPKRRREECGVCSRVRSLTCCDPLPGVGSRGSAR